MPENEPIRTPGRLIAFAIKNARDAHPEGKLDWKTVEGIADDTLAKFYPKEFGPLIWGDAEVIPPNPGQVAAYARAYGYNFNGEDFCDFYESKGWLVGKAKMKNWQAACRTWARKDGRKTASASPAKDYTKL